MRGGREDISFGPTSKDCFEFTGGKFVDKIGRLIYINNNDDSWIRLRRHASLKNKNENEDCSL